MMGQVILLIMLLSLKLIFHAASDVLNMIMFFTKKTLIMLNTEISYLIRKIMTMTL